MCRIAGIFNPASSDLTNDIITMTDCMKHGGPDDKGIYIDDELPLALGHRRLSFLDLSKAGHQPMSDLENRLQIVFNGEIYNFSELKNELKSHGHIFRTTSDTEVILKSYLQWGKDCFRRFNGMFALALYDKRSSILLLARDHAGIKPLYYSITGNCLYFASEVRAFTEFNPHWAENKNWRIHFLTFGNLPEPVTTLQNVVPLQKGKLLIISLPDLSATEEVFARFTFQSTINTLPEAVTQIREKLTAAVDRHLISDAPIGLFLSGGIDSSLLTLLAYKTLKNNLHTISIVFDEKEFSEAKFQKIIIDKMAAKHSSFTVNKDEFYQSVPDILRAMDQPSIDGVNSYFICKYAKKIGLKAVLSGIGADELFGGYHFFTMAGKIKLLEKLPSFVLASAERSRDFRIKKVAFLRHKNILGEYLLRRAVYTPYQVAAILDCTAEEVNRTISHINVSDAALIQDARDVISSGEQHLYMQNQLLKDTDFMSMWHGLEVRVPFLDKQLMETVHSIAPSVKYDPVVKKHLLIKAFADILPEEIYQRKKKGFAFPLEKWISAVQTTNRRDKAFVKKLRQVKSGQIRWGHYWAYLLSCHKDSIKYYDKPVKKILFLNLKTFSVTGGIEKFNRAYLKALSDLEKEGIVVADAWSMYDDKCDSKYFDRRYYQCFNGKKIQFILKVWKAAFKYDIVILAHINLSLAGWGVKKIFPRKEIILNTHGIEVWMPLGGIKKTLIQQADKILAVSNFTKNTIANVHNINPDKITVFHNTIDPYFSWPDEFKKPEYLLERYNLKQQIPVIFTLTRLSYSEKYKGYDKVMQIIPFLKRRFPDVKYILSGKPDVKEEKRLVDLKETNNIKDEVLLTGFVKDEEVTDHYLLADVFILPSRKEGFGIVFIEAMACGVPVIGGNKDGTADALQQGKLGYLIDPDDEMGMLEALENFLSVKDKIAENSIKKELQQKVMDAFGFETFKQNLKTVLA